MAMTRGEQDQCFERLKKMLLQLIFEDTFGEDLSAGLTIDQERDNGWDGGYEACKEELIEEHRRECDSCIHKCSVCDKQDCTQCEIKERFKLGLQLEEERISLERELCFVTDHLGGLWVRNRKMPVDKGDNVENLLYSLRKEDRYEVCKDQHGRFWVHFPQPENRSKLKFDVGEVVLRRFEHIREEIASDLFSEIQKQEDVTIADEGAPFLDLPF